MNKHVLLPEVVVLMAVLAVGAVACGDDGDDAPAAEIPVVDVMITDQGFVAPESVPGGLVRIRAHNRSTVIRGAELVRLKEGATLDQYNDAVAIGPTDLAARSDALRRLSDVVGGVARMQPGSTSEVVLELEPGHHVFWDFIPDSITRPLEVTAAPADQPAEPEAEQTISMIEYAFDGAPDTLPAGPTTFNVVNEGGDRHMMAVVSEKTLTAEQVQQSLSGTPLPLGLAFTGADGGIGELEPGDSGWVTFDLDPGVYVLTCWVFDRSGGGLGKTHTDLGMSHAFTVE